MVNRTLGSVLMLMTIFLIAVKGRFTHHKKKIACETDVFYILQLKTEMFSVQHIT